MKQVIFILLALSINSVLSIAQTIPLTLPQLGENVRRSQLLGERDFASSFLLRPINLNAIDRDSSSVTLQSPVYFNKIIGEKNIYLGILPIYTHVQMGVIPYPEASVFLQAKGFQSFLSAGLYGQLGPISIQIQPECIYAQNAEYSYGFNKANGTEYLERFGEGSYRRFLPGQSSLKINLGAFSLGASTENIWWGPAQFNALLFSNNAFGFEHLTLNTRRPAKTFLGGFEGQLIMGRLENSNLSTSNLSGQVNEWRYMNGINLVYQPKWISGLYLGASRVFQIYNNLMEPVFADYFPIFEAFQKVRLGDSSGGSFDSVIYDDKGQDQQATVFARYVNTQAKAELYFEYGRRDHAFDWREAILNPEHARAYLFGFNKLFSLPNQAHFQLRGEALQQQESINILIRYGPQGGANWSGHSPVFHGFTHRGQMLGPGIGPSSNAQTLEGAWVKGFKKLGLRLERLNRHQDVYTRLFNDPSEQGRWVDFSTRILADWQWDKLIISSSFNFINSINYQWQLHQNSTYDFPTGKNLLTFQSQLSIIYLPGL